MRRPNKPRLLTYTIYRQPYTSLRLPTTLAALRLRVYDSAMRGTRLPTTLLAAAAISALWPAGARAQMPVPPIPRRCQPRSRSVQSPKITVARVDFSGPSHPPDLTHDQMLQLISRHAARPEEERYFPMWQVVRGAWQDEGYLHAVVQAKRQLVDSGPDWRKLAYQIQVDPGPRYRLGLIEIDSADAGHQLLFSVMQLRSLVPLGDGQIFDMVKLREGMQAIQTLYARHGYIDETVSPETIVHDSTDTINLRLVVDQGKQFRIAQVQAPGLDPSLLPTLQSKLKRGSVFNPDVIREFYQDEATDIVSGASPSDLQVRRNEKAGTVDLLLDFRACPLKSGANGSLSGAGSGTGPSH